MRIYVTIHIHTIYLENLKQLTFFHYEYLCVNDVRHFELMYLHATIASTVIDCNDKHWSTTKFNSHNEIKSFDILIINLRIAGISQVPQPNKQTFSVYDLKINPQRKRQNYTDILHTASSIFYSTITIYFCWNTEYLLRNRWRVLVGLVYSIIIIVIENSTEM